MVKSSNFPSTRPVTTGNTVCTSKYERSKSQWSLYSWSSLVDIGLIIRQRNEVENSNLEYKLSIASATSDITTSSKSPRSADLMKPGYEVRHNW